MTELFFYYYYDDELLNVKARMNRDYEKLWHELINVVTTTTAQRG